MSENEDWREILKKEGFREKRDYTKLLNLTTSTFLHKYNQQLTKIQKEAIKPIYNGEDAILISNTASGKTEAAVIPITAKLAQERKSALCIYVAPTKALLNDLYKRLESPLHSLNLELGIRHGDKPLSSSDESLSFLLTTPESLDILLSKEYPILLKTKYIVCDEIHQVYGLPRGLHLIFLIDRLQRMVKGPLQRIALSATVGNQIKLAHWFTGKEQTKIFKVINERPIEAEFHWIDKEKPLSEVIISTKARKILIFANSRKKCDELFLELNELSTYRVFIHYSTLEKQLREYVETQFKRTDFVICIATTTLELGIDIGSIETVILYEPPQSVISFLQRIGRGSRRAGKTWVIMTPKNRLEVLRFCALTSLAAEGLLEESPSGEFFSVFIQQIFSCIGAKHHHRLHVSEIEELCKFLPWIQPEELNQTIKKLVDQNYLVYEAYWSSYQMGRALESIFNESAIFSNISERDKGIQIIYEGQLLARVPLPLASISLGSIFVFAGRFWEVISVRGDCLRVRLSNPTDSAIRPAYGRGAGGFLLPSLIANRMKCVLGGKVDFSEFIFDERSRQHIDILLTNSFRNSDMDSILLRMQDSGYAYYTFAGGAENLMLKFIFTALGYNCRLMKNAWELCIQSDRSLNFKDIPDDQNVVYQIMEKNWNGLSPMTTAGAFFGLLPAPLKRKEVLSQFDFHEIFRNIKELRNRDIVRWSEGLF